MWIDEQILALHENQLAAVCYIPEETLIVLGSSNFAFQETHEDAAKMDHVEIVKRMGGGGTVVLSSSCIVISIGAWVNDYYKNDIYFKLINSAIIEALSARWPKLKDIKQRGISDLVFEERKICGSSMFRSRNYLMFQASLLVDNCLSSIEKYLAHPSKEPEYRKQKSHRDFVGFLSEMDSQWTKNEVLKTLSCNLTATLQTLLSPHLCSPISNQFSHLKKRLTFKDSKALSENHGTSEI